VEALPLLRTHTLDVGSGHRLHVQEYGCEDGLPALVLHGGPGSGCSPLLRRAFDGARYRVICIDQRGAGLSTPHGGIEHNTTAHLLADLRFVRERLGIGRWLAVGGSWGAALAVAHAAHEPDAVSGLLLRASFLARPDDIDWFFGGAAALRPAAWTRFSAAVPATDAAGLAAALREGDAALQCTTALAWWRWERALALGAEDDAAAPPGAVARYRVQSHYLAHGCWLQRPTLLERCEAVPRVPTLLLHARDDLVCRADGARLLQARLPGSRLQWLEGGGHDAAHAPMQAALRAALDRFAVHADFGSAA
jgi:proline iminopeptidase